MRDEPGESTTGGGTHHETRDRGSPLDLLLELIGSDPRAPTSVRDAARARRVHLEDSLSGLEVEEVRTARRIADIGSGAGFPGLVLAASLPDAEVDLIEATSRKCEFLRDATARTGIANARVICDRAEAWAAAEGAGRYQVVTARAVGRLSTLAELASPLLADGGILVAWKGARDRAEEEEAARASLRLAMVPFAIRKVHPYPASRDRHIHLLRKNGPTPGDLPRRPGMAAKRPFGAE